MNFSKSFAALSMLGTLTLSAPAWADIPPDDACMTEGTACHNAIVDGSLPLMAGTCQKTMCTRATPDGSMTYDCLRCVAEETGAGGQSNEGGGSSTAGSKNEGGKSSGGSSSGTAGKSSAAGTTSTAGKPADPPQPEDDDAEEGGCSVSQAPGGARALGTGLLVLGLAVAGIFRRRSPKS